ncbi:hypothetical protein OS493_004841 [Desmophyllum pertusum]|uniref:Uncharacterized protein n=1 Tax=Desmophyllum pertusum TaxID=174260 RepID=A0A9X0CUB7_9CNID|nr:hypothetical protein OS493_004841 [Desmophyllum pertusum]
MKPAPVNVSARVGLWVATVFVICSAFLICNMEGRLQESLQTNEKPNPNIPLDDDQSGAREKRSVKQKTQVSSISDLEKRLEALEKRINANNHSVMSPKQQSDWWFLAYVRGRDGRDGREGMTGPLDLQENRVPQGHQENRVSLGLKETWESLVPTRRLQASVVPKEREALLGGLG